MRKPRLTERVLRGLEACVDLATADDLDDMEESGNIQSAEDVLAAEQWLQAMRDYRREKSPSP